MLKNFKHIICVTNHKHNLHSPIYTTTAILNHKAIYDITVVSMRSSGCTHY